MLEAKTVQWVSAGGDHSTDFWGSYAGMNLSYGRKTGVGSYGPKYAEPGARVFEIRYDEQTGKTKIDSWIRERTGNVDKQPTINKPMTFSAIKSDHCYGSEKVIGLFNPVSHGENYWLPSFIS